MVFTFWLMTKKLYQKLVFFSLYSNNFCENITLTYLYKRGKQYWIHICYEFAVSTWNNIFFLGGYLCMLYVCGACRAGICRRSGMFAYQMRAICSMCYEHNLSLRSKPPDKFERVIYQAQQYIGFIGSLSDYLSSPLFNV